MEPPHVGCYIPEEDKMVAGLAHFREGNPESLEQDFAVN
jgi:hypothetical protein